MPSFCPICMSENPDGTRACIKCGGNMHTQNKPHQLPVNTILYGRYLVGKARAECDYLIDYIGLDLRLKQRVIIREVIPNSGFVRSGENHLAVKPNCETGRAWLAVGRQCCIDGARESGLRALDVFDENNTSYLVLPATQSRPAHRTTDGQGSTMPNDFKNRSVSPQPKEKKRKVWILGAALLLIVGIIIALLATGGSDHEQSAQAGKSSPPAASAEPVCDHNWLSATCTEPKTCSLCGETKGSALGHDWKDADYENPKTCSRCGKTEGEPLKIKTLAGKWSDTAQNFGAVHTHYYILDKTLEDCSGISFNCLIMVLEGTPKYDQYYLQGRRTDGRWVNLGQFTMDIVTLGSSAMMMAECSVNFEAGDYDAFTVSAKYAESLTYSMDLQLFDPVF